MKLNILLSLVCLILFIFEGFGQTIQKYSDTATIAGIAGIEKYDYYIRDSVKVITGAYDFEATLKNADYVECRIKVIGNFKDGNADGKWIETWVGLTSNGHGYKRVFISNFKEAFPEGGWIYTDTTKSKEGKTYKYNKLIIKNGKLVSLSLMNSDLKTPTVYNFDANGKFNYPDKYIHGFDVRIYEPDIDTKLGLYYHKGDDNVYIVWDKYWVNLVSYDYSNLAEEMNRFKSFANNLTYYCNEVILDNYYFKIGYGFAECNKDEEDKYYQRVNYFVDDSVKLEVSVAYFNLKSGIDAYNANNIMEAKKYFEQAKFYCNECPIKGVIYKKLSEVKALTF